MIKKRDSQNRPEQYYSEMLLRQYPWLKDKLKNEEYPIAFSHRKPETLLGLSLVFIGLFVVFDTLFHTASFGNALFVIPCLSVQRCSTAGSGQFVLQSALTYW